MTRCHTAYSTQMLLHMNRQFLEQHIYSLLEDNICPQICACMACQADKGDTLCDAVMKAAGYDTTRTVVLIDSRLLMARALHECCRSHHHTRRGHHHGCH